MIDLIANTEFSYAGKLLRQGDKFTAAARDADLLQRVKRASVAPVVEARAMDVQTPARLKKAGYNRRDMKART